MAVDAVVFDIGETLVDETGMWERAAAVAGVTPFTLMGVLGGLAARGEHHDDVVADPRGRASGRDLGAERLLSRRPRRASTGCAQRGLVVAAVGNTPLETEEMLRPHVTVLGSSGRWGIAKPAPRVFARVIDLVGVAPGKIAYVGDRVDNDVGPALAAGMVGVHIKRGPWGYLHEPPPEAIRIRSLDELPAALA